MKTSAHKTSSHPYGYEPKSENLRDHRNNKKVTYNGQEMTAKQAERLMKQDQQAALEAARKKINGALEKPTFEIFDTIGSDVTTYGTRGQRNAFNILEEGPFGHRAFIFKEFQKIQTYQEAKDLLPYVQMFCDKKEQHIFNDYKKCLYEAEKQSAIAERAHLDKYRSKAEGKADTARGKLNDFRERFMNILSGQETSKAATIERPVTPIITGITDPAGTGTQEIVEIVEDTNAKARQAAEQAEAVANKAKDGLRDIATGLDKTNRLARYGKWAALGILGTAAVAVTAFLFDKCSSGKSTQVASKTRLGVVPGDSAQADVVKGDSAKVEKKENEEKKDTTATAPIPGGQESPVKPVVPPATTDNTTEYTKEKDTYERQIRRSYNSLSETEKNVYREAATEKFGYIPTDEQIIARLTMNMMKEKGLYYFANRVQPHIDDPVWKLDGINSKTYLN